MTSAPRFRASATVSSVLDESMTNTRAADVSDDRHLPMFAASFFVGTMTVIGNLDTPCPFRKIGPAKSFGRLLHHRRGPRGEANPGNVFWYRSIAQDCLLRSSR